MFENPKGSNKYCAMTFGLVLSLLQVLTWTKLTIHCLMNGDKGDQDVSEVLVA